MQRIFRRQKRAAQFAERRQLAVQNHLAVSKIHSFAPRRIGLALFINGNALAEPARHSVFRGGQGDDVAELMPEHVLPIRGIRRLRGRAVGRDDRAKTDAEIAGIVRHPKRPHGKIFLLGKNIHHRWLGEFDAVFARQSFPRARQQIQHAVAVKSGFQRRHVDDEVRIGQRVKFRHLVVQGHKVERGDIVAILLVNFLGELPAFVILPRRNKSSASSRAPADIPARNPARVFARRRLRQNDIFARAFRL